MEDVNIALHDALERRVVDSAGLPTDGVWLEEDFWAAETFGADSGDVAVNRLVGFLLVGTFRCGLQISIITERNNISLTSRTISRSAVVVKAYDLHQILREVGILLGSRSNGRGNATMPSI